ncbi:MAG: Flp pilus assembly protein CpaB [Bdellovibrionales bacterium]|nr:Flp pilus assembly protein CpaB [Bdellovibrionales bacterium]
MSHRFGSVSNSSGMTARERLFCLAGGALSLVLAAFIALFQSYFSDVDAIKEIRSAPEADVGLNFGTIELLVPTQPVPYGTALDAVKFRPIPWPRTDVPQGAVMRRDTLAGMYAKVDLPGGQPVSKYNLSSAPMLGGIVDQIPKGYRASTIEVDATAGVEGWARPGAHVDIVLAFHDRNDGEKKAKIVVEDAVVTSFNGQTQNRSGLNRDERLKMSGSATVTLITPVRDALTIQAATSMGRISLMLRSSGDLGSVGDLTIAGIDLKEKRAAEVKDKSDKGYVRFSDDHCRRREFVLRDDGRWYASEADCLE